MIRILLADDHTLFRNGLRRILEDDPNLVIVAETGSGLDAVNLAQEHCPDIAILDVGMGELNGIEATAQIVRHCPDTTVLILSMHADERYVLKAVKAGASGYILKDSVEAGLLRAIHQLHAGQHYFSPQVARILAEHQTLGDQQIDDRYELLTERERQVYQLLAEGMSNKEIASRLGLSLHTVETHRTRIMDKMQLHGIAELVLSAVRRGLVH